MNYLTYTRHIYLDDLATGGKLFENLISFATFTFKFNLLPIKTKQVNGTRTQVFFIIDETMSRGFLIECDHSQRSIVIFIQ